MLRRADSIRGPARPWSFSLRIVDYLDSQPQSTSQFRVYVRGAHEDVYRSLVLWTAPDSDRGKAMLMDGNVYWMYSPGTRNPIRISAAQRFSGLASSADVASTNFEADYNIASMSTDTIDQTDAYRLDLDAKSDEVAYHKIELWVNQATCAPMQARYYAVSGRLLKSARFGGFRSALDESRPHEIVIADGVRANHTTRMAYSNMSFDEKPAYMYQKDFLSKVTE
jgi:hypothetical protein